MRKDKGLNGDLDRLPMLTWVMFLKFLDDSERMREQESVLAGERFVPAIVAPYRWRDWAAKADGITGDELIAFINQQECIRPDGKRGAGLFTYLRGLEGENGGTDRRDVIATVFKGTINRMINGYLLRDVIAKVNEIHFDSTEELHTLGHLYESLLREMRDAAGDSGEFYTPRAVVRFMVAVANPKLGESVLDPACGTGGFLVEAYQHLAAQCKTVAHRRTLQQSSIFGGEAKPLPYLLAQMNLLLHGLEAPRIRPGNSLDVKLTELGERDRVDVILTNPPFGGEEERGILSNFPEDKRTAETTMLFLQLIMRKLRRAPKPGRAAVVVPNGTLFGDGVCARIKGDLLKDFRLHTIVRLPNGVFAPYTGIPTNLLFFSTVPARPGKCGITSSRCPKAGRTTPRPSRSSSRSSRRAWPGGMTERKPTAPGAYPPPICSPPAATSTARTQAPRKTSPISRRNNSSPASWKKKSGSRRLSGGFRSFWGRSEHEKAEFPRLH